MCYIPARRDVAYELKKATTSARLSIAERGGVNFEVAA